MVGHKTVGNAIKLIDLLFVQADEPAQGKAAQLRLLASEGIQQVVNVLDILRECPVSPQRSAAGSTEAAQVG